MDRDAFGAGVGWRRAPAPWVRGSSSGAADWETVGSNGNTTVAGGEPRLRVRLRALAIFCAAGDEATAERADPLATRAYLRGDDA